MDINETDLTLRITSHGDVLVYHFQGVIDIATSPSVRETLVQAANDANPNLVVDLTQVTFLDSTGIGALIGAHRRALERAGKLRLVVPEGQLERLFSLTGLAKVFPTFRDLDDALSDAEGNESGASRG